MAVLMLGYTRTEAGLASPVIIRGEYADRYGVPRTGTDNGDEEVIVNG